jgi:hypothetical protein
MAIRVDPDEREPTHLLSLTGYNQNGEQVTLGFNPVDQKGTPSISAIRYSGYPTGTLRVNMGSGDYSTKKPPYGEFSRRDWSGGLGQMNGDKDATRYFMGKRVWSVVPERMMLAPRVFRATTEFPKRTGNWDSVQKPITWLELPVNHKFAFKANANHPIRGVEVLLRTFTDNIFTLTVHTDNAGNIGSEVTSVTITDVSLGSEMYQFIFEYAQAEFWYVISALNTCQIATVQNSNYPTQYYNGSAWATSSAYPPLFTIFSDENAKDWIFFRYRRGTYAVSGKTLLLNGDRGACDNSSDTTLVVDSSKNWIPNQWVGAIVVLNDARLGWRRIVGNTATTLTVDRPWTQALTNSNWYVIHGSPYWTKITVNPDFEADVQDAETVREETVYFALGSTRQIKRMHESLEGGEWVRHFANENQSGDLPGANFLVQAFDQVEGPVLYKIVNGNGFIAKAPAVSWGTNLTWGTEINIGLDNFEDLTGGIEYDGKFVVTAMDSIWMVRNGVPDKVSIDMESQWTLNTGRRPAILPPYLVFPFGNRVQRLYNNLVENFGPERDYGLPARYDGLVMDNLALVGGLVIVKDGGMRGEYSTEAEGGAFLYRQGGWHPMAFTGLGNSMKAAFYQRLEDEMDFIWFGDRNGLHYTHTSRAWDYTEDARYDQTNRIEYDGWFISGWYDTGRLLPQKWWDFISIFASNLSPSRRIRVYYQLSNGEEYDNDNTASRWTFAGEVSSGYTNHITLDAIGRRIRFLFLLIGDGDSTPVLEGYTVNYISRDDDAESWQIAFRIKDIGYTRDGTHEPIPDSEEISNLINYWARTVRPLQMRCHFDLWDNREVVIERPGVVPLELTLEGREVHYAQMTIRGVEEPPDEPLEVGEFCPLNAPANSNHNFTMNVTIQPDEVTTYRVPLEAVLRTPQHTHRTTYRITGTWYKLINDVWTETTDDDFYEVRAYDRLGNIVAVGTKHPVTDPNVRTGYLETIAPTRIYSIGVHIIGTPFRPQSIETSNDPIHDAWDVVEGVQFSWGYTDYGVWGRISNWRCRREFTLSGWGGTAGTDYLLGFWAAHSRMKFKNTGLLNWGGKISNRVIATWGTFGVGSQITNLWVRNNNLMGDPRWREDLSPDLVGGTVTREVSFVDTWTPDPNQQAEPQIMVGFNSSIFDYVPHNAYDFRIDALIYVSFAAERRIVLQGLELDNVC